MKYLKCRMKQITLPALILTLTLALIYGCTYNRGLVYREWTETMSQLGIFPVFPPREDVQVGDVWLLPMHPFATGAIEAIGGLGMTGVWCDNILFTSPGTSTTELTASVNDIVSEFYNVRPSFPSSTSIGRSTASAGPSTANIDVMNLDITKVPEMGTSTANIFTQGDIKRLRQVAFPEFAITNIKQYSLNALVPVEYLNLAGGFTSNRVRQVSLKIPSAESYGLPAQIVLSTFFRNDSIGTDTAIIDHKEKKILRLKGWDWHWNGERKENGKVGKQKIGRVQDVPGVRGLDEITAKLARAQFNEAFDVMSRDKELKHRYRKMIKEGLESCKDSIWVALVNEVFYARAIDINISTLTGRGGAANVQPITNVTLNELERFRTLSGEKSTTNTTQVGTDTVGRKVTENIQIVKQDDVFELAKKINDYNKNLDKQSVPGGSINVVSVSENSVGLRRFFDRPVAVGVRGVIMRINVNDYKEEKGFKVELFPSGDND